MTKIGSKFGLLVLIATTIGCDRVTKHAAALTLPGTAGQSFLSDMVRLEYAENTGGFLSLGADLPPAVRTGVFTIGTAFILLATVVSAIRLRWSGWSLFGVGLAFAGGASNLADRVARGSVIDFINIGIGPLRTGIFNVADVAVMLGILVLVISHCRSASQART